MLEADLRVFGEGLSFLDRDSPGRSLMDEWDGREMTLAAAAECYPITVLPHISALYQAYLGLSGGAGDQVAAWYGAGLQGGPFSGAWMRLRVAGGEDRGRLASELKAQALDFHAREQTLANIERFRAGARAVVTGQQVGLLGGPLLVLEKAATAIVRAREATARTGEAHVPVFWLATEDHDLAEVDQVGLLTKTSVETLRVGMTNGGAPVGGVILGDEIEAVLAQAEELLEWAPMCELLRSCYAPGATLGSAFGRLLSHIFAEQGLIVMDGSSRECHAMGEKTLRYAIENAGSLEEELIARSAALEAAGFHAQVKVADGMSLLFLISDVEGAKQRVSLRRSGEGWKAGRESFTTAELLGILEEEPERISPNALLRPVFQDTILPVAAYVGGPAEIAYWAQSGVVYERVLGAVTPVLPRLTATLLEPAIATVMDKDEVQLPDSLSSAEDLALRLGARAMPIELKRRLAAVGNAMESEIESLAAYLGGMDASLGRSAEVSGSKMRYQMSRLRRLAARAELEKEESLRKHAAAITLNVFPQGHPQERVVAGVWYLARYERLIAQLLEAAQGMCGGHAVVRL